jgi:hypothetical protein
VIQRELSRVLVLNPLWQKSRCQKHRQDIFVLDTAFLRSYRGAPAKDFPIKINRTTAECQAMVQRYFKRSSIPNQEPALPTSQVGTVHQKFIKL